MNNLEKEFIPYQEAFELKELGFDEPCFGYYLCKNSAFGVELELTTNWIDLLPYDSSSCKAPLYQQAFRWFREKYGYLPNIHDFNGNFKATLSGNCNWLGSWTKTYEEAELACLKKLIEIVKNK
jgi:hypothetical protein